MKPSFVVHSYPVYIADWRDSETRIRLTLEERGLLWELIFYCAKEGSLPSDDSALMKICSCSRREFLRTWPRVKSEFLLSDGRFHHRKVDKTLQEMEAHKEKQRLNGRTGALTRWGGHSDKNGVAIDLPIVSGHSELIPSSPLLSSPQPNNPGKEKTYGEIRGRDLLFEQFWQIVWAKIGKGAAKKAWNHKIKDKAAALAAIEQAKLQGPILLQEAVDREGSPVHPATWLNQERWLDERPVLPLKADQEGGY